MGYKKLVLFPLLSLMIALSGLLIPSPAEAQEKSWLIIERLDLYEGDQMCLAAGRGYAPVVFQTACDIEDKNQHWFIRSVRDTNAVQLRHKQTNQCMTIKRHTKGDDRAYVHLYSCNGPEDRYQQWWRVERKRHLYALMNRETKKCLDAPLEHIDTDGVPVQQYGCHHKHWPGTLHYQQLWSFFLVR